MRFLKNRRTVKRGTDGRFISLKRKNNNNGLCLFLLNTVLSIILGMELQLLLPQLIPYLLVKIVLWLTS